MRRAASDVKGVLTDMEGGGGGGVPNCSMSRCPKRLLPRVPSAEGPSPLPRHGPRRDTNAGAFRTFGASQSDTPVGRSRKKSRGCVTPEGVTSLTRCVITTAASESAAHAALARPKRTAGAMPRGCLVWKIANQTTCRPVQRPSGASAWRTAELYKLRPCPSYSRRRDRINLGLWRSLYKGGAGYTSIARCCTPRALTQPLP